MNREILFRGKRIDNEEWIEGYLFRLSENFPPFIMLKSSLSASYEINVETVGQYTGLTDKNGVKIFEGDIIIVKTNRGNNFANCIVEWYNKHCCGFFLKSAVTGDQWVMDNGWSYEVIGNIYDNLDLVGGEKT